MVVSREYNIGICHMYTDYISLFTPKTKLLSKLLKRGYIGDYMENYYRGY